MGCFPLNFSLRVTTFHYKGRKAIAFVGYIQWVQSIS